MSGIKVTWDIGAFNPEKHYIYRSSNPISPTNLPTPLAEVGQGVNEYTDLSIVDGETYHYFVAAEKMGLLIPTNSSIEIIAVMDSGPGPLNLMAGDNDAGFFGEVNSSEFINGTMLANAVNLSVGTARSPDEPWLKFIYNNKILFIPKKPFRYALWWEQLYDAGLVYGTNTVGSHPQNGNTVQDKLVEIEGYQFKVRLMTGASNDPATIPTDAGGEWNALMYPIHIEDPTNMNWGIGYSDSDIGIRYTANTSTYGYDTLVQESYTSDITKRIRRGGNGIQSISSVTSTQNRNDSGWRPVLELIR